MTIQNKMEDLCRPVIIYICNLWIFKNKGYEPKEEDISESEAWSLICRERTAAIELLPESFPDFHGYLFMTFEQGENDDNSK